MSNLEKKIFDRLTSHEYTLHVLLSDIEKTKSMLPGNIKTSAKKSNEVEFELLKRKKYLVKHTPTIRK